MSKPQDATAPIAIPAGSRILIVRLSAIGDIVFASPLISALRRACPDCHLAWLVQPECLPLLDHHPDLDETLVCPFGHWRRLWRAGRWVELARGIAALRRTLGERRFDLAIDLQGLLKSGLLARLSGAPQRIGLGSREWSDRLMTRTVPRGGESKRIASEYLYLAQTLGLPTDPFELAVHYSAADAGSVAGTLVREGLGEEYAVLCPFTTRPQKHWVEGRWASLAARLGPELGLKPVLLGGPGDRAAAERIADLAGAPLTDLVGRTSLGEAAALIDRAALLVGVDTGLAHMGVAFATPSVLLFGSTCPYLDPGRANARVIYHPRPCSPCKRRPSCNGAYDCMAAIETAQVLAAAREVMGASSQGRESNAQG
jgi:heptosyltransferase-1